MKPEFSPPSAVRNAGSPSDRFGLTRRSTRRSEMLASSEHAIASASSAKASGWPWKLPFASSTHHAERPECANVLCAVAERRAPLRRQTGGLEPRRTQSFATGQQLAFEPRRAFPDERKPKMREGCKIPARTDRAAARDIRENPATETLEQELDGLDPRPRVSLRQRVGAQEHRGTDDFRGIGVAHPAGVTAEQAQLQLL